MTQQLPRPHATPAVAGGIRLGQATATVNEALQLRRYLLALGLTEHVTRQDGIWRLDPEAAQRWLPAGDTLGLHQRLAARWQPDALELRRQIVVAMLAGPWVFEFPSCAELRAAVRVRERIVRAARQTALAFRTEAAERPAEDWCYHPDTGFTLRPGRDLIAALRKATQPRVSGRLYDFSCYRATEYVILLALAQEAARSNPALLARLQRQWECKAIMSGSFHDTFLREYGHQDTPLPTRYYVPGDRLWFRNPDEASADATGYEGSWVFYLGHGEFSDFWRAGRTYTLESKCLEIYHWRDGLYRDARTGASQIDEGRVAQQVAATLRDPAGHARIQASMQRYREPRGCYTDAGGCIDTTREYPRCICPADCEIDLPDAPI